MFNAEGFISAGNNREIITDIIVDDVSDAVSIDAVDGGGGTPVIIEGTSTGGVLALSGKDKGTMNTFVTGSQGLNIGLGFSISPSVNAYSYTGDSKDFSLSEHYAGKSWAYTFPIPYTGSSLIISRSDEPDKKLFHTYGIGITPGYNFGVQKNTTELIFNQTPK